MPTVYSEPGDWAAGEPVAVGEEVGVGLLQAVANIPRAIAVPPHWAREPGRSGQYAFNDCLTKFKWGFIVHSSHDLFKNGGFRGRNSIKSYLPGQNVFLITFAYALEHIVTMGVTLVCKISSSPIKGRTEWIA
jgi:hypothetical protein